MLTLGNLFVLMLLGAGGAWLWHAHGLRERALAQVKQHCLQMEVILLDENVALRRIALLPDARGRKRLARVYGFEFTVTGEQRHVGSITLFGQHVGHIELAPHPFVEKPASAQAKPDIVAEPVAAITPEKPSHSAEVIQLSEWRRSHDKWHH